MAAKIVKMEKYVTTGQEAISGEFPWLPFTPLVFTVPHLKVAKFLTCLGCGDWCGVTEVVFDFAIFEMLALKKPAVGTTFVGMHIFTKFRYLTIN